MLILFDENRNVSPVEKPRKPRKKKAIGRESRRERNAPFFEKEEQLIRWETAKWDEPMQENIVVSAPYRKGELVRQTEIAPGDIVRFRTKHYSGKARVLSVNAGIIYPVLLQWETRAGTELCAFAPDEFEELEPCTKASAKAN